MYTYLNPSIHTHTKTYVHTSIHTCIHSFIHESCGWRRGYVDWIWMFSEPSPANMCASGREKAFPETQPNCLSSLALIVYVFAYMHLLCVSLSLALPPSSSLPLFLSPARARSLSLPSPLLPSPFSRCLSTEDLLKSVNEYISKDDHDSSP